MDKELYNFKFWYLCLIIVFMYILINYLTNSAIYTDSFYYALLSGKIDIDRITDIITMQHKFQFITYCFLPVILLLKFWILGGVIFTGLYLFNQNVSYKDCLKIILIAELVAVVAALVKTAWLMAVPPNNANDIQYFSPLSLTQLINMDNLPKYLFYPLQLFNIFEVAYWLVLAYGVRAFTNWKFEKSIKAVASSYGIALAIWVVIVMFIQVQFS